MKTKTLSNLEQKVMNIVWELNSCSVREVSDRLNKSQKLAYTTVATILLRLHEKGLVARKDKNFIIRYSPRLSKKEYGKREAGSFIERFFSSFGNEAIVSFAESIDKLPKDKKIYLLKLLENYAKNK